MHGFLLASIVEKEYAAHVIEPRSIGATREFQQGRQRVASLKSDNLIVTKNGVRGLGFNLVSDTEVDFDCFDAVFDVHFSSPVKWVMQGQVLISCMRYLFVPPTPTDNTYGGTH